MMETIMQLQSHQSFSFARNACHYSGLATCSSRVPGHVCMSRREDNSTGTSVPERLVFPVTRDRIMNVTMFPGYVRLRFPGQFSFIHIALNHNICICHLNAFNR